MIFSEEDKINQQNKLKNIVDTFKEKKRGMFYNDYFVDCKLAHLVPLEDADRIFMRILNNYDSLKKSDKSL
jgi:hypothetical protein